MTSPERHGREYIQARIREEIARSARFGHPFALLIFELLPASDGIPTRRKMEAGIEALNASVRNYDVVARAFDDTVVVLLIETDAQGARDALLRIRNRLARAAGAWQVTTYNYPQHQDAIETLPLLTAA